MAKFMRDAEPLKPFIVNMGGVGNDEAVAISKQHAGYAFGGGGLCDHLDFEIPGNLDGINRKRRKSLIGNELLRLPCHPLHIKVIQGHDVIHLSDGRCWLLFLRMPKISLASSLSSWDMRSKS